MADKSNEATTEPKAPRKQIRRLIAVLTVDGEGKPCVAKDKNGNQLVSPPTQIAKHMGAITDMKAAGTVAEIEEIVYDPGE